jgi:hypothetical protein
MPENPYAPPLGNAPDDDSRGLTSRAAKQQRPPGVSLLSVLMLVGGVAMFLILLQQMATLESGSLANAMGMILPVWLLLINFLLLAAVATAAGVGMWKGAKWGWQLGAFYILYAVFGNISSLVTVIILYDQFEATERGAAYYLIKHGTRVLIRVLVFMYFFKGNVLHYFGLENIAVPKAVGMLVAVCVSITLAFMAVGYIAQ